MKINIKNPNHVHALLVSATYSFSTVIIRPFLKRDKKNKIIIFYGHTLNGNLKVFYDYLQDKNEYSPYFLVLEKEYYLRLKKNTEYPHSILYALSFSDMIKVARSDVFFTSHALHFFSIYRALTSIKFVDLWHAISYKGYKDDAFKGLHDHDETWVSSLDMRKMYINRYKFQPKQVKVTGFARADLLINGHLDKNAILKKYSIPKAKKYILVAPTWKQDDKNRSVVPFNMKGVDFLKKLDEFAREHSAHIIFRTHLNSSDEINVSDLENTSFMPYGRYEVVEDFLFIADILVTDWSSIGIDYLPLQRPAIFLDVPVPFKYGFNLGPEYRYGDVVSSFGQLISSLDKYLKNPEKFKLAYSKLIKETTEVAYGNTLDGKTTQRYFNNLQRILKDS